MATVNPATTQSTADIYSALSGSSSSTKSTSATADMENKFLTLLTTQLKNQDPLNPLDNAQVTSQLAQINTVSGIEKLNATMAKLMSAYDNTQALQQAGMIGRSVLTAGSALAVSGKQGLAGIKLDDPADSVVVTVKNSAGKTVQTQELGAHQAGSFSFVWDGKNDAGDQLPDGKYTFSVEAKKASEKVGATALQLGTVSAVTRTNSGFVLDLGDGSSVKFADVQQIL